MSRLTPRLLLSSLFLIGACSNDGAADAASGGAPVDAVGGTTANGGDTSDPESGGSKSGSPEVGGSGPTAGGSASSGGNLPGVGGATGAAAGTGGSNPANTGGQPNTGGEPALPSQGCSASDAMPTERSRTVEVGGEPREYLIDLPLDYQSSHPYRLVLGFHGLQYDAEWVANGEPPLTGPYFGLQEEANDSTIFVAPQALTGGWSNQDGRDVDFVDALLAELAGAWCVDRSRVFSVGFSYGAIMTVTLACERPDSFRAFVPMSASLPSACSALPQPLAYLGTHGLQDNSIPLTTGELVRDAFLSANGCSPDATTLDDSGCASYAGCAPDAPVRWCTFEGEHVPAPFAGPVIWDFLSQF